MLSSYHPSGLLPFSKSAKKNSYISIPSIVWLFTFILCSFMFLTKNPGMSAFSVLVFPFLAKLTWRKDEPPIFFFGLAFQWLAASMMVFRADLFNKTLESVFGGPEINQQYWLNFIGLMCIALALRFVFLDFHFPSGDFLKQESKVFSIRGVTGCYFFVSVVIIFVNKFVSRLSMEFGALPLTLLNIKWGIFFILAFLIIDRKKNRIWLWILMGLEIIQGFGGFFSDFKMPFLVLFMVFLTSGKQFKLRQSINIILVITFTIWLAVVWTAVKPKYRNFLNQGSGKQEIKVGFSERIQKFFDLCLELDSEDMRQATLQLTWRLAMNDNFARALRKVPSTIPHTGGAQTFGAIKHILTPRIFFPNKPIVDDSLITTKYTGRKIDENTSIGIGYMGEMYIDFGISGMFVPVVILGFMMGYMYRFLMGLSKYKLLGFAMSFAVFINVWQFEMGVFKLLGSVVMNFLVLAVLLKFGKPLQKFLLVTQKNYQYGYGSKTIA